MRIKSYCLRCAGRMMLPGVFCFSTSLFAQTPVVTPTNTIVRVMAANLSSGNLMRYESPGLNILKGLKPDVVAMQEFNCSNNFGINTTAAFRSMIDDTFGTNFVYFRESGYTIPNGIISRYPFVTNGSGSWVDSDAGINDRGFAWARIDVPGTNDLYVVSVHLKASSGSVNEIRRADEAAEIKALIRTNFPASAWIIVAGDFNLYSETEDAIVNLNSFLSDSPVPADLNGGTNTNRGRSERYDRVLVGFSLTNSLVPVVLPSHTFSNGLVFVSTNYVPLSDVSPVQYGDSLASNMQHMAVVKDFMIALASPTNAPIQPALLSALIRTNAQFQFLLTGTPGSNYVVQASTNLSASNWISVLTNASPFTFVDPNAGAYTQRFYRAWGLP